MDIVRINSILFWSDFSIIFQQNIDLRLRIKKFIKSGKSSRIPSTLKTAIKISKAQIKHYNSKEKYEKGYRNLLSQVSDVLGRQKEVQNRYNESSKKENDKAILS